MRVALFGGSFNPPHVGHLLAATYVRAVAPVDAVWLMPAHRHPFGKQLAPFEDRVALCRAMAGLVAGLEVTEVEAEVPGDGRTIRTVEHLQNRHPGHAFSLIVGSDILHESHKWFEFERLVSLAPLIVLARTGHAPPPRPTQGPLASSTFLWDVAMPEVSSTEVRARLARGDDASHLVAGPVLTEIARRGLYASP
jgi:nicotinate-nucleotide adenylyltransferase